MWKQQADLFPFPLPLDEDVKGDVIPLTDLVIPSRAVLLIREYTLPIMEAFWGKKGESIFLGPRAYSLSDAIDVTECYVRVGKKEKVSTILSSIASWASTVVEGGSCVSDGKILPTLLTGAFHRSLNNKKPDICQLIVNFLLSHAHLATPRMKVCLENELRMIEAGIEDVKEGNMFGSWRNHIPCSGGCEIGIDLEVFGVNPLVESARYHNFIAFMNTVNAVNLRGMKESELEEACDLIVEAGDEFTGMICRNVRLFGGNPHFPLGTRLRTMIEKRMEQSEGMGE